MEEDSNSWLRRTKFSHTICYRLESLQLGSFPVSTQPPPLKSGVQQSKDVVAASSSHHRCSTIPGNLPVEKHHVFNKQRSLSPPSQTALSREFKEARSDQKRYLTPQPQRREHKREDKRVLSKEAKVHNSSKEEKRRSVLRHFASFKGNEKSKSKKESSWTKCFEHGGGKVAAVEAFNELSVDMSKLFFGTKFAYGAHSRLYHGEYYGKDVAVKIIDLPEDDENGDLAGRLTKQFSREVTLLSRLRHPNVIKLISACSQPLVFCIITEYLPQGSLRAYLHKLENKSLPMQKLIAIALDIARGMEYIHSQGVIHRDLKPENIIIGSNFCLKIADFGIACEVAHCDTLADDPGTYRWMAPEMIKRKPYGRKVDVYSFGLILYELVAGRLPYENLTPIQAAYAVVHKKTRPVIPSECPPLMQALIERCWSVKSEKRPEFWQVVKVLEHLESSIGEDGTLMKVEQKASWEDHKKGLKHWVKKLRPNHSQTSLTSKSKFI